MTGRYPLVKSDLTPEQIIGENMALIEAHFTACCGTQSKEEFDRATKKFTEHEKIIIEKTYLKLRRKGIWPHKLDKFGNIKWGYAMRSDLQNMVDALPLPKKGEFII